MNLLKNFYLHGCKAVGLNAFARWRTRNGFRILAYHGVEAQNDDVVNYDGFQVTPAVFREQLDVLKKYFHVVSLTEVLKKPFSNAVVLTFDDGYRNNLATVAPILKEYDFPATFFITTGFIDGTHRPWWYELRLAIAHARSAAIDIVGEAPIPVQNSEQKKAAIYTLEKRLRSLPDEERSRIVKSIVRLSGAENIENPYRMMNGDDVKKLAAKGFEIGAHTVSHPSLAHETIEKTQREIEESVCILETMIGRRPIHFAYPYGSSNNVNEAAIQSLKKTGLETAVTTIRGMNREGENPFMLKRMNVTNGYEALAFERLVSGF